MKGEEETEETKGEEIYKYWKSRRTEYIFNQGFLNFSNMDEDRVTQFYVPVVYGYIYIHALHFDDKKVDFILISRKDCRRLGRRFVCRGLDQEGNAANFAETEQIIIEKGGRGQPHVIASYVQIRGSIPLIWTTTPNLKLNPRAKISSDKRLVSKAANSHFDSMIKDYKQIVCVNLVDMKGFQKNLGEEMDKVIADYKNPDLQYEWFDFHHECRKLRYENISILINKIDK